MYWLEIRFGLNSGYLSTLLSPRKAPRKDKLSPEGRMKSPREVGQTSGA